MKKTWVKAPSCSDFSHRHMARCVLSKGHTGDHYCPLDGGEIIARWPQGPTEEDARRHEAERTGVPPKMPAAPCGHSETATCQAAPAIKTRLDVIRERWERATPRPWGLRTQHHEGYSPVLVLRGPAELMFVAETPADRLGADADMQALLRAPEDVAHLIGEVTRLREALGFYADPEVYRRRTDAQTPVAADAGRIARKTLKEAK